MKTLLYLFLGWALISAWFVIHCLQRIADRIQDMHRLVADMADRLGAIEESLKK